MSDSKDSLDLPQINELLVELSNLEQISSQLDIDAKVAGVDIVSYTEALSKIHGKTQEQLRNLNEAENQKISNLVQT